MRSIDEKLDVIIANQNSFSESTKSAQPDTKSEQAAPATEPTVPETNSSTTALTVSMLYNNELLAVPVSKNSKITPFELTYPGYSDRNLNVMISGAVSKINLVDEKCNYISSISFKEVNKLNYFYFYMDNDGNGAKFYFEIVTTDNQNYYFGVNY